MSAHQEPPHAGAGQPDDDRFVGREVELLGAHETAAMARRGSAQILLVSGAPGIGKSAFLEQVRLGLVRAGWLTAVGRCPERGTAPPAWPWVQAVRSLAGDAGDVLDVSLTEHLAPLLQDQLDRTGDVARGRFRLHHAVAEFLVRLRRPLVLILDDLEHADSETLAILRSVSDLLTHEHSVADVLLAASYRSGGIDDELEETLSDLARHSPARLHLRGLDEEDAAELVRQVTGLELDEDALQILTDRSRGNPLYLHEGALLLTSEAYSGNAAEVFGAMHEVLRRRLTQIPYDELRVLRLAALIGAEIDEDVLTEAADAQPGILPGVVRAAIEAGLRAKLLIEGEAGARFAHTALQEALLRAVPQPELTRWHEAAGHAVERFRPQDYAALAYHYAQAGTVSVSAQAIAASVMAGRIAGSRFAHDAAAALYQQGINCAAMLGPDDQNVSDDVLAGLYAQLVPALLLSNNPIAARDALQKGLDLAERAGRDDLATQILCAADVPLLWAVRGYGGSDARTVSVLRRLLSGRELDPLTRCTLLCVLVREQGPDEGGATRADALAAVELARSSGDPARICHALGVLAAVVPSEAEPQLKRQIAAEMLELGVRSELPAGLVLGHRNLLQAAGALTDLPLMHRHLEQEAALAQRYELVQSIDACRMTRAMLDHVAGRLAEAERGYLEGVASIRQHRSLDAGGLAALAVFTVRHTAGREGELAVPLQQLRDALGPAAADMLALAHSAAGQPDAAAAAYRAGSWPRQDALYVILATLRGAAAVVAGAVDDAPGILERLRPFAGQIAGLGSGAFAAGPVAQVLGDLSLVLGRQDDALAYYRQAGDVCLEASAPLWGAAALAALRRLEWPA